VMTDNCTDTEMAWLALRAEAEKAESNGEDGALERFEAKHGTTPPPPEGITASAAFRCGVSVASTVGNKNMKAGCLNRAIGLLMPAMGEGDVIMNFDADSVPERHFVANALKWIRRGYSAVGATFHGRPGGGLLGLVQRSEFARFARHQHRKLHCDVLSGTGAAFPVWALRKIAASRPDGTVYDIAHITEDFELTLAAKHLGLRAVAPADCQVTTDVMETYKDWWTQRKRWQLGTLYALRQYGWTKQTRELIIRQLLIYIVMLATPLTAVYLAWSFVLFGWRGINPVNAPVYAIGVAIVIIEQAWQARRAGVRSIGATLGILPDLFYSVIRQLVYIIAAWMLVRGKQLGWGAGTEVEAAEEQIEEKVLSMNPIQVPWAYAALNHVVQVFTVSMALLALVRLRPSLRRNHDPRPGPADHLSNGHRRRGAPGHRNGPGLR
jgi:poly-beta-1,6-N-acetyl-D-glucosamine synthase